MTSKCIARVAVWASECGFCPPKDYYTVAIQCERAPDSDGDDKCLCKIHNKNLPFGTFGKKAPMKTLTKCSIGKGDSKFNFKEGEKMCWLFKKPDGVIGDEGFGLVTRALDIEAVWLDNTYWKTEYKDEADDEADDEEDDEADDEEDDAGSDSDANDFKGIPVADMRERCDSNNIPHDGLSKADIRQALVDHANSA